MNAGRPLWRTPRFSLFLDEISPGPEKHPQELVAIVIMVIPVAIGMPAVAVLVPPTMPLIPAAFPRLAQFVPRTIRLLAVPAVVLDGFVQFVIRLSDAALTAGVLIGAGTRRSDKGQQANKRYSSEHRLSKKPLLSRAKHHVSSILPNYPRLEWGVLFHKTHLRRECSNRFATS
jgi:hypothetical protein